MERQEGQAALTRAVSSPSPTTTAHASKAFTWKTVWLDHISFEVTNYNETTAFSTALLGWKPTGHEGSKMGHVSFGIAAWDTDPIKAELTRRGLASRDDTGGKGDIHDPAARYKSHHTTTPDGYDLRISNTTKANRMVC